MKYAEIMENSGDDILLFEAAFDSLKAEEIKLREKIITFSAEDRLARDDLYLERFCKIAMTSW